MSDTTGWVVLHRYNGEEVYIRPQAIHAVTPPGPNTVPEMSRRRLFALLAGLAKARVYIPVDDIAVRETPAEVLAAIAKAMPRQRVSVPVPPGLIKPT